MFSATPPTDAAEPRARYLLLRVRHDPAGPPTTLEVEAQVDYRTIYPPGRFALDLNRLAALAGADRNEYGRYLGERLASCLPAQLALAEVAGSPYIRLRILLEATGPHESLRWERLEFAGIRGESWRVATDPNTPLARFAAVNRVELEPPDSSDPFHLCVAVASPRADGLPAISAADCLSTLVQACAPLLDGGWMRITLLPGSQGLPPALRAQFLRPGIVDITDGAATARRIAEHTIGVHGLHLIAHGSYNQDTGAFFLLLESDNGELEPARAADLISILQPQQFRLVFLESCQSAVGDAGADAALAAAGPHVGSFLSQLVEAGVPGVVAMQDRIAMDDARSFHSAFYSALVRNGRADEAVNAARSMLANSPEAAWSIPVLATRLKDAALWREPPLRPARRRLAERLRQERDAQDRRAFPIDVVSMDREELIRRAGENADDFDQLMGSALGDGTLRPDEGLPVTPAVQALADFVRASAPDGAGPRFACLVGNRGRGKTAMLEDLFLAEAEDFAKRTDKQRAVPVMFRLADLDAPAYGAALTVARAVAQFYRERSGAQVDEQELATRLGRDAFVFLVMGDDQAGDIIRRTLALLQEFADAAAPLIPHRFLISLDQNGLRASDLPAGALCMIVQPMRTERVRAFLKSWADEKRNAGPCAAESVLDVLDTGGLWDLAEVPWLLAEMLGQARAAALRSSRAAIIGRVVDNGIARYQGPPGSAGLVNAALQRMAWDIQNQREGCLTRCQAFTLLDGLRGNADFPLFGLLDGILQSCGLLAAAGADRIAFNYPGFRTFFSARYLLARPEAERTLMLEDITAQLGRRARADRWRETLFILAGLWSDTTALLQMILSGSLLHEGEQIFIAARCLQEARLADAVRNAHAAGPERAAAARKPPASDHPVVRSIVTGLLRVAHPVSLLPVITRKRAIQFLAPLKEDEALPGLLAIALGDDIRPDRQGRMSADYSGVRLAAMKGLRLYDPAKVTEAARRDPAWSAAKPALLQVLEAWTGAGDPRAALEGVLRDSTDGSEAVAAFALALACTDGAFEALRDRFLDPRSEGDTLWAVADSLLELGAPELAGFVHASLGLPARVRMLVYLVGKLGTARPGSPEWEFLDAQLGSTDEDVRGRTLQALAELNAPRCVEICHLWLTADPSSRVRYYALRALRHVGNAESLALLEKLSFDDQAVNGRLFLENLRREVYEEIYWRLAGGLCRETMVSMKPAAQATQPDEARSKGAGG